MPFTLLVAAALTAVQPASASPSASPPNAGQGPGRPFLSPMGEPVFGRTAGEDGIVAWFQQTDRNHDGSLTVDEMQADAERFFQRLDTNHDGEIDPDEITHYEQVIAPEVRSRALAAGDMVVPKGDQQAPRYAVRRGKNSRRGGGGGYGGGFGGDDEASAGRYGLLQIPEPVSSADADFNRGVSLEEFRRAAVQRFNLLDASHNGRLTLPELEGIHEAAASAARRPPREKSSDDSDHLDPEADTEPQM